MKKGAHTRFQKASHVLFPKNPQENKILDIEKLFHRTTLYTIKSISFSPTPPPLNPKTPYLIISQSINPPICMSKEIMMKIQFFKNQFTLGMK